MAIRLSSHVKYRCGSVLSDSAWPRGIFVWSQAGIHVSALCLPTSW